MLKQHILNRSQSQIMQQSYWMEQLLLWHHLIDLIKRSWPSLFYFHPITAPLASLPLNHSLRNNLNKVLIHFQQQYGKLLEHIKYLKGLGHCDSSQYSCARTLRSQDTHPWSLLNSLINHIRFSSRLGSLLVLLILFLIAQVLLEFQKYLLSLFHFALVS